MKTTFGIALSLLLAGCEAFEEPTPVGVMPINWGDITVAPPATIRFDDVEPMGRRFHPVFGTTDLVHSDKTNCCQFARCTGARSPAVVDLDLCFAAILEYRRAKTSGLSPDSADHILLVSRANEKFADALAQVLTDLRIYDTVFIRGMIRRKEGSAAKGIPDLTEEVVRRLTSR